jgi:hypothetical protein
LISRHETPVALILTLPGSITAPYR